MSEAKVVGVDVAAKRPCTCVLLQGVDATEWLESARIAELTTWITRHQPDVVAIDAPCATSMGLLRGSGKDKKPYAGRVCDRELRRRGIPLYEVPGDRDNAPQWMKVGFALYDALKELGYQLPRTTGAPRSMIEVYPHASFVTLLEGTPAKKTTILGQQQRTEVLRKHGLRFDGRLGHDELDALAAALTAQRFLEGQACALGAIKEALIWLPVRELEDSYHALPKREKVPDLRELQALYETLSPEARAELLESLLIAAPRGGEAMVEVLEQLLLCHSMEELIGEHDME